jgi:Co/Zn/Cd efflux system component
MERSMQKTVFKIRKMDCGAEEQMVRLKLGDFKNIASLEFDIPHRRLDVYHTGDYRPISEGINQLGLDASFVESNEAERYLSADKNETEKKLLLQVLFINLFFFILEIVTGFISGSMGLVADSLDMLADSLVYGLALFAVGGTTAKKKNIAKASGYFQLLLAVFGIIEVLRRFFGPGEVPAFQTMIAVSIFALGGNAACLYLLQKSKSSEAHIKASVIFTSNDVIINLGVILAGALVFATKSKIPDLAVGAIVFLIVARGAYHILRIARN